MDQVLFSSRNSQFANIPEIRCLLLLLSPFFLSLLVNSLSILLPLYIYPGSSASAWKPFFNAIKAYPKVNWLVIVNPDSGPGTTASYPSDPNVIAGISQLNSFPNAYTLGYVDTAFTNRSPAAVNKDIDVYASWSTYKAANISIGGIFFDDVNNTASSSVYKYMQSASSYAYKRVPSAITKVVYNPGAIAPKQLFGYCDFMVEFEDPYSSYRNATTIKSISSDYRPQSAILAYNTPTTANVANLVHTMKSYGVGAVYFTADCCYNAVNQALLAKLALAILAA